MNGKGKIGFGCVGLTSQPFESTAIKLLEIAFNEGITHFDTAPIYGKGYSEKIVGKFLRNKRSQVTVTTKFGLLGDDNKYIPIWLALPLNYLKKIKDKENNNFVRSEFHTPDILSSRRIDMVSVRNSFQQSLRNLRTDHIDYYLLHEALPNFLTDEACNYILNLKSKGLVKNIGIATSYPNFKDIYAADIYDWDILQYENSLLHPSDNLLNFFSNKKHFYHSVLKPLQFKSITDVFKNEIGGILLARSAKINAEGIILFSSSKIDNIKSNLKNFLTYDKYSVEELNNIISNAIH